MKIIADSSSTRTEWCLVEGNNILEQATTGGLNPYFQSRREISHKIRLELPQSFFKRRWEHVYFYGAGCSNDAKKKIIESSIIAQFKTPTTVESDLLGAARGLLINEPGLACIIGTGSNSCLYDGTNITKNVRPLGFILGDEGSGSAMGKRLVGDILKDLAPAELSQQFFEKFSATRDSIMESVYGNPNPNTALSSYSFFLADHLDHQYVRNLIRTEFESFFSRCITQYDYRNHSASFVGAVACLYSEILCEVADNFGVEIKKIIRRSMPGLVSYHAQHP